MSASSDQPVVPDVDRLARSMLLLHGGHHDDHRQRDPPSEVSYRAPAFSQGPEHAAALSEATRADRERYLNAGLQPVSCRFCDVTVKVKKLGPTHTAVQWNAQAAQDCAYFCEIRASGGDSKRIRACPKLADSIDYAVADGHL